MQTIDKKIQDCKSWREAQKNLENFEKIILLMKKYPAKSMQQPPLSPPYDSDMLHNY